METNVLLKELQIELRKVEKLKLDYQEKNKDGKSDFYDGAVVAIESTENHIKRAIARAIFPDKVKELQEWIGVLCEAYRCNNHITWDAIAEQVVYEMFKDDVSELKQMGE